MGEWTMFPDNAIHGIIKTMKASELADLLLETYFNHPFIAVSAAYDLFYGVGDREKAKDLLAYCLQRVKPEDMKYGIELVLSLRIYEDNASVDLQRDFVDLCYCVGLNVEIPSHAIHR